MANNPMELETQSAQPGPVAVEEAPVPRNYWDEAYKGLDEEVKSRVSKLKQRFDKDTIRAIRKLGTKTSDHEALRKLQEIKNSSQHSDARTKGTLGNLNVRAKGRIQLLAWTPKKKLDDEDICSISAIYEACVNEPNEASDESQEDFVSVDELLQLCRERQEIAKEKSWKFDFLGRQYVVHELWGSVVDKVDKLRPIIDAAASSQSTANTVWSVVKVVLQFAVQGGKEAGAILAGINTAVSAIQRCVVYDRQVRDTRVEKDKVQTHIQAFETCLISTYSCILKFLSEAGACLEKSQVGIYWHAFWSSGSIVAFESDIFEFEHKLFQDSMTISAICQNDMAKQILDLFGALNTQQEALASGAIDQNSATQYARQVLFKLSDNIQRNQKLENKHRLANTRENMLGWWSSSKVEDHHEQPRELRAKETGDWVFQKEEYKRWSEADSPRLLWIKGIPGAGKTVLISRIIDHYLHSRRKDPDINDFQLAYFYCKSDAPDRRFSHDIFRSFIRQLAGGYHPLPERLRLLYEEKSRLSSLSTKVKHKKYRELLLELIPQTTETILILDALDECIGDERQPADSNEEMKQVLKMFKKLLKSGLPVKLIVSSRYDSDIEVNLRHQEMITILSDDNRDDILKMVENQIDKYNKKVRKENLTSAPPQKQKPKPEIEERLRTKMLQVFIDKSQGQFQWASMHIKYLLSELRGPAQMETELGKLPQDLTESYNIFFERIYMQSAGKRETARRVFRWLLASNGSCEITPLIAAICQKLEGDRPDTVEGDKAYILTACQNLVTSDDSVFRFSHLSVQEYAEKHQLELTQDCHYDVALVCVWVVFRYETQEQAIRAWAGHYGNHFSFPAIDDSKSELYDLWQFAANQWYYYFQQITDEAQKQKIRETVLKSFTNKAPSVDSTIWLRLQAATIMERWLESARWQTKPESIIMLALQPINWISSRILQRRKLVFPGGLVPIQAILAGIMWKTRHLLHEYLVDESWCEDLSWEIQREVYLAFEEEKSQLWNTFQPDGKYSRRGRQSWPSTLLTRGTLDPLDNRSPLVPQLITHLKLIDYRVQEEEFTTLLRMLLLFEEHEHGDQVQNLCSLRRIFEGMVNGPWERKILEELARLTLLLICAGATPGINLAGDTQEFAKYLLTEFPDAPRVQYHHLVPAVEFLDWSSMLVDAAGCLEQGLLEILISHGADVNSVTSTGSPLISAVANSKLNNTQVLLQNGADVNVKFPRATYGTALIAGCAMGHHGVLKTLLDIRGIEVNAVVTPGKYATALIAACAQGHAEIVKQLLQRSVYVNETVKEGTYATALFAAADARCIRAVQLLLKNGARAGAREALRAVMGGWTLDAAVGNKPIQSDCQSLTAWLTLRLIRSIQDDDDEDDDDDGNVITQLTRQLNRAMSLDSLGTSQALIESFGFSLYEHPNALAKGFQAMLLHTDKEDWRIVKDAWAEFLDLAEEVEGKHISDPLIDKLVKAEVRAVRRRQSIYEMGPPSDEERADWD